MKMRENDIVIPCDNKARRYRVIEVFSEGYLCLPIDTFGRVLTHSRSVFLGEYDVKPLFSPPNERH